MDAPSRARTTVAGALGLLGLGVVYGGNAAAGFLHDEVGAGAAVAVGVPLEAAGTVAALLDVIVLVIALLYVRLAVGVLMRSASVREGALFVTAVLGVLSVIFAVAGFLEQPPAPNRFGAAATAAANLVVLGLLWHRDTRDDVARVERARSRRTPTRGTRSRGVRAR